MSEIEPGSGLFGYVVHDVKVRRLGAEMQYLAERLPEFRVEDCIDDRVQERVDVAQPCCQDEGCDPWRVRQVQLGAQRVQDGAREKWCPAD